MPDPFDGLLPGDLESAKQVHACLGCSLHVDRELVGVLTLDAANPQAFDTISDTTVGAFAALAAATLRNVALIRALEQSGERQRAIAHDLMQEALRREGHLIGRSASMHALRREIAAVATTDLAVLITGETGTGKELVARTVHALSPRAEQALVQINCAALPESVAESELFGHKKGAFTGAHADRAGKFELAHGGTLFLDEIGELPLGLQAKLLRALQQGEIQRVGADETVRVNVRVIAATNRDLLHEVEAGRFRADLYHRLHVYPIAVPPLRELEHVLLRACVKAVRRDGHARVLLNAEDLALPVASLGDESARAPGVWMGPDGATAPVGGSDGWAGLGGLRESVDAYQRGLIVETLAACQGNWTQAAQRLDVDRANLRRLARRLGVESN